MVEHIRGPVHSTGNKCDNVTRSNRLLMPLCPSHCCLACLFSLLTCLVLSRPDSPRLWFKQQGAVWARSLTEWLGRGLLSPDITKILASFLNERNILLSRMKYGLFCFYQKAKWCIVGIRNYHHYSMMNEILTFCLLWNVSHYFRQSSYNIGSRIH